MDVRTSLTYLSDLTLYQTEKIYELWMSDPPQGISITNSDFTELHNILIHDARHPDSQVSLDTTGFEWVRHKSRISLTGEALMKNEEPEKLNAYLEECIDLVKGRFQPDHVICFDWRYRKSSPKIKRNALFESLSPARDQTFNVAHIIHSDVSQMGGVLKLQKYLHPKEWAQYEAGKWRIRFVNVWRPMIPTVEDAPLGLCDRRTVHPDDFLEVDKVHDDYMGENNYLKHAEGQTWYYLSKQNADEPVLFLTWDSAAGTWDYPGAPPHTSFENPLAAPGAPKRESIEVRIMVFTEA